MLTNGLCEFCRKWLLAAIITHPKHGVDSAGPADTWRSVEELQANVNAYCWTCVHVVSHALTEFKERGKMDFLADWFETEIRGSTGVKVLLPDKYGSSLSEFGSNGITLSRPKDGERPLRSPHEDDVHYVIDISHGIHDADLAIERVVCRGADSAAVVLRSEHAASEEVIDPTRVELVSQWLSQCQRVHACFPEDGNSQSDGGFMPKRLLYLEISGRVTARLVETSSLLRTQRTEYATLSHCWGKERFLTLTEANYAGFRQDIPLSALARTFREAIKFCASLGISFLWIDSLCIVQGEINNKDWLEQAPIMDRIYGNSVLTLAACASTAAGEGLIRPLDPDFWNDVVVDVWHKDLIYRYKLCARYSSRSALKHWGNLPIFRRGWCVQELLLSPRVLYFTDKLLFWRCQEEDNAESGDPGWPHLGFLSSTDTDTLNEDWMRVAQDYGKTSVTVPEDRVYAMAGLAAWFGSRFAEAGTVTTYCAGCWEHDLARQLVWACNNPSVLQSETYPDLPSWSWMRMSDVSILSPGRFRSFLTIVRLNVSLKESGVLYGPAKTIHLVVRSNILSLTFQTGPTEARNEVRRTPKRDGPVFSGQKNIVLRYGDETKFEFTEEILCPCGRTGCVRSSVTFDNNSLATGFEIAKYTCSITIVGAFHEDYHESGHYLKVVLQGIVLETCGTNRPGQMATYKRVGMATLYTLCELAFEKHVQPVVAFVDADSGLNEEFVLV